MTKKLIISSVVCFGDCECALFPAAKVIRGKRRQLATNAGKELGAAGSRGSGPALGKQGADFLTAVSQFSARRKGLQSGWGIMSHSIYEKGKDSIS